jgi:hypothetical protein
LQTGRGIPIDFTVAANCFKKPADSNGADGIDGFGCCLERGEGMDPGIHDVVFYYRSAHEPIMSAAWSMTKGLAKTRFTRQKIIACRLKREMLPRRTALASALTTIYPSPLTSIGEQVPQAVREVLRCALPHTEPAFQIQPFRVILDKSKGWLRSALYTSELFCG